MRIHLNHEGRSKYNAAHFISRMYAMEKREILCTVISNGTSFLKIDTLFALYDSTTSTFSNDVCE